ncbi:nephrin [Trichonephila clavata]|uniref:Nephrin n=1 Tax=Trichonephila clavata TaxID=2740835 RepID=A0A8X6L259_TRICU|nr:nephrin [Trichonephila clavata]
MLGDIRIELDPPSAPSISGYEAGKSIKAGDLQKLSCVSSGGNPSATLKWFKNDKELRGVEKTTSFGSTSELVIRIEASDNGATYRCEAMNSALKTPLTATVAPSVLFPPGSVSIKMKPRKPKAGDSLPQAKMTAIELSAASGTLVLRYIVYQRLNEAELYDGDQLSASNSAQITHIQEPVLQYSDIIFGHRSRERVAFSSLHL